MIVKRKILLHEMSVMDERPPWFVWVILVLALFAVSSAGAVFRTMTDIPPILKAAWRLQATTIVLIPGFLYQWKTCEDEVKSWILDRRQLIFLGLSGVFLWLHFATWVWSLDHTSLTHSLLFVTSHPLVVVAVTYLLGKHLSRLEILGAIVGFLGAVIALQAVRGTGEVTLVGDLAAFLGGVFVVGYLMLGRKLRREGMPLHLYALPVTAVAAILLTLSSLVLESTSLGMATANNATFGWLDKTWLLPVAYLALGPGYVGHTGNNAVLRWLPALLISVTLVLEPVIGALIGWVIGVEAVPELWTWIGLPVMLSGMVLVIVGLSQRDMEGGEDAEKLHIANQ